MEVVEHVDNPQKFLASLSECAKDDGLIILSTIQRNFATWLIYIVMRLVPVSEGGEFFTQFIDYEFEEDEL